MTGPRRVAITGLGAVSAIGGNAAETWSALSEGRCGIAPIVSLDTSGIRFRNGAEARGFDASRHFDPVQLDFLDRFAQFALVAAREALADSGLRLTPETAERTAVYTGSCLGGQTTEDAGFADLYRHGRNSMHPLSVPRVMANAGASQISMDLGLTGPACTISTACASANHAIGHAFWMVRAGLADVALTGGSEAPFSYAHLKAWEAMRVVSPETCRPFSADRKGLILGEGAGMLVLEPLDAATARGARVYGEVAGFGMSSDAHHLTQPSSSGAARAMRLALDDAGLAVEQVGYVNAHGTGTRTNDPSETRAIREVFGSGAGRLAVSSTKSMHGHALGAAGALEAVATTLALHHGLVPPTANFTTADPECDLDVVPNAARPLRTEAALSNSFAFGGLNAVLAFRAPANA